MWQWVINKKKTNIEFLFLYNIFFSYHTFCLELPGVPNTPEWMCPLCEVDQLSADEDLYEDSDPEELQYILFDDTLNTTLETDNEVQLNFFLS
jgi:hypothetical protein